MESFSGMGQTGASLARQMAKLLATSDPQELEEIVRRWLAEAPTERVRRQYELFGAKLLELKRALASAPEEPSEEELELALTMMLKLAVQGEQASKPPRR
jgi:urease accessory protein UreF